MKKVDIKGGKFTFSQRIKLGEIFTNAELSDIAKFEQAIECMTGKKPKAIQYAEAMVYFKDIVEGLRHWIDVEIKMLHYEPTTDEINAGVNEYSEKVGIFGTVKAIAKTFCKDPDEVLNWEYGKVFMILYSDLEENKFQRNYYKVLEKKHK